VNPPGAVAHLGDGIERVQQQVEDDLLELHTIAEHLRQIRPEVRLDEHPIGGNPRSNERKGGVHEHVQIDRHVLAAGIGDELARPVHDAAGPIACARWSASADSLRAVMSRTTVITLVASKATIRASK
jgi:hypothetical protein